jgi:hypothetical protein
MLNFSLGIKDIFSRKDFHFNIYLIIVFDKLSLYLKEWHSNFPNSFLEIFKNILQFMSLES